MIVLRSVTLRPQGPAPMKRKVRGRDRAGLVYACLLCGWESAPIKGSPNFRAAESRHELECNRARIDSNGQAAMVGPRFTHRESEGGDR